MPKWTHRELATVSDTDEIQIAAENPDGTLRAARPIWAVRVGDDLYARAAYGPQSAWHRVARQSGRAEISVGGRVMFVAVEDVDASTFDGVDEAYRQKYGPRYASIVASINSADSRASTVRLSPIETDQ